MTLPTYPPPIRPTDIAGRPFPPPGASLNPGGLQSVQSYRAPYLEPPATASHFLVAFSTTVASGARIPLFSVVAGNIVFPSAAVVLPDQSECRISAVEIGGDAPLGAPTLFFSLATQDGTKRYNGFDNVPLPGRGGIYAVGFEPILWVRDRNAFIGGWVENTGASGRYVEMFIQGWFWSV